MINTHRRASHDLVITFKLNLIFPYSSPPILMTFLSCRHHFITIFVFLVAKRDEGSGGGGGVVVVVVDGGGGSSRGGGGSGGGWRWWWW